MKNGVLGLSFWLALAAGILVFGVTWVLGGVIWWQAALFGAIVFAVLLAVLAYAFDGAAPAAHGAPHGAAQAAPAQAAPAHATSVQAAPEMAANSTAAPAPVSTEPAASAAPAAAFAPAPAPDVAPDTPAQPSEAAALRAPETLSAPRGGRADDLKVIEGIGPALEKLVNSLGFYHYDQIAGWSAEEIAWVDSHMKTFRGRITRDKWQAQAKIILAEGIPAFLERAKTNNY